MELDIVYNFVQPSPVETGLAEAISDINASLDNIPN